MIDQQGIEYKAVLRADGEPKQGANALGGAIFNTIDNVFRELLQNSTDNPKNPDSKTAVRVEVDLIKVPPENIPGRQLIRDSIRQIISQRYSSEQNGEARSKLSEADQILTSEDAISVLKFSDKNTTGLYGNIEDETTPYGKFFGSIGISGEEESRSGSKGHGKLAPYNLSKVGTCLYSSYCSDKNVFSFYGLTLLESFKNDDENCSGKLSWRNWQNSPSEVIEFESAEEVLACEKIPEWLKSRARTKQSGTDVYIVAFDEDTYDWQQDAIIAVLKNFFVAVIDQSLEFKAGDVNITHKTIGEAQILDYLNEFKEKELIDAVLNTDPIKGEVKGLGSCLLYIKEVLDPPTTTRHVAYMRKERMLIQTKKLKAGHKPWVAVFICNNPEGSKTLRKLENSTHTSWDYKSNTNLRDNINKWIKDNVNNLMALEVSDGMALAHSNVFSFGSERAGGDNGGGSEIDVSENETAIAWPNEINSAHRGTHREPMEPGLAPQSRKTKPLKVRVPRKKKKRRGSNPNSRKRSRAYSVENLPMEILKSSEGQSTQLWIENTLSKNYTLRELEIGIPDGTALMDIVVVTGISGTNNPSIKKIRNNVWGPFELAPGANLFSLELTDDQVLLQAKHTNTQ